MFYYIWDDNGERQAAKGEARGYAEKYVLYAYVYQTLDVNIFYDFIAV